MSHYDPNKHGPHHGHNQPQSSGDLSPELRKLYNHLVEHIDRGFHALKKDIHMASANVAEAMTRLTNSVARLESAAESENALLRGIAQQLRDNRTDPAAIDAIADHIDNETDSIVAATLENTPVVPNPNTTGSNPRNLPDGSPNPNFDPNLPETA